VKVSTRKIYLDGVSREKNGSTFGKGTEQRKKAGRASQYRTVSQSEKKRAGGIGLSKEG